MEWAARAVGAFYIFAGIVALNAGRQEAFLDKAIAAISGEPADPAERLRGWTMMGVGGLTLVSGLTLALLSRWAAPAFLANLALQGAYLAWARKGLPPEDAMAALGRRRTINAFLIYLAASVFVLMLFQTGVLT